jgi:hypothetical protein
MKYIKNLIRNKFYPKLSKYDLLGYRNILKLVYHKKAEHPLLDINMNSEDKRFFIDVPSLKITLIINDKKAEIINSYKIWPLDLNEKVYKRAVKRIYELKCIQMEQKEKNIKIKKQNILEDLYQQIK